MLVFRRLVAAHLFFGFKGCVAAHSCCGCSCDFWLRIRLKGVIYIVAPYRTFSMWLSSFMALWQVGMWGSHQNFVVKFVYGLRICLLGFRPIVASGRIFILAFKSAMAAAPALWVSGCLWLAQLLCGVHLYSGSGSHRFYGVQIYSGSGSHAIFGVHIYYGFSARAFF